MNTHAQERSLILSGFRACYGTDATLPQAQCLQAISWLETNYGAGWSKAIPGAAESRNRGAITAGAEWTGATFEHRDSYPNPSSDPEAVKKQPNIWYTTKFRSYLDDPSAVEDLARIVYMTRLPPVLNAASRGDTLGFSTELYNTGYYKGFGATPAERVGRHRTAVDNAIALQCRELGEAFPRPIAQAELLAMAAAAEEQCMLAKRNSLWLLTLEPDEEGFGPSPHELDG